MKKGQTTKEEERKPFKVLREHSLKIKGPQKEKMLLKPDGCIYKMFSAFGAMVSSPLTQQEIYEILTDDIGGKRPKSGTKLRYLPSDEYVVPLSFVRTWGQQLLEYDSEALCVYGVSRKNPKLWLAVVPKQEVTGGSVDVKDFGKALSTLSSKGYKVVGTIHTHPGAMTSCSKIDTDELWDGFSGVHLIITHTGVLSYHFSTRGITWSLYDCEEFKPVKLWGKKKEIPKPKKESSLLLGEDGSLQYRNFIKKKTYTRTVVGGKKRNLTYYSKGKKSTDVADIYYGYWNSIMRKQSYLVQERGQQVCVGYVKELGGYWDKTNKAHFAGKPFGYEHLIKSAKDKYIIVDARAGKSIIVPENPEKEKKKNKGLEGLIDIVDWMESQPDPTFADMEYNLALDDCIKDVGFALTGLERFLMESISQHLYPSKRLRSSIIRVLMLMPKIESLMWGQAARGIPEFAKMIPPEWKGMV